MIITIVMSEISFREGLSSLKEWSKELAASRSHHLLCDGFWKLGQLCRIELNHRTGARQSGDIFPFVSPVLGWIGVFITGSVVSNNALLAPASSHRSANRDKFGFAACRKYRGRRDGQADLTAVDCDCNSRG